MSVRTSVNSQKATPPFLQRPSKANEATLSQHMLAARVIRPSRLFIFLETSLLLELKKHGPPYMYSHTMPKG